MPVTAWATVAGNNTSAPPNGAPEGMLPSGVNDVLRQIMADVAVEAQTNNVKALKTIAGTNTITADMDPELAAYVAQMIVVFTPANTNTGATTLAIDGLAALAIKKGNAVALVAGDLVAGIPALLVLNSAATNFVLINPQLFPMTAAAILAALLAVDGAGSGLDADLLDGISSAGFAQISTGSFTGTLVGVNSTVTGTIYYSNIGGVITLSTHGQSIAGTSNQIYMQLTGLPAAIYPSSLDRFIPCIVNDVSSSYPGIAEIGTSGTITFLIAKGGAYNQNGFTNSGTKGFSFEGLVFTL